MFKVEPSVIQSICRQALDEDICAGDATTLAVVPQGLMIEASFNTREDCVCAGWDVAETVFQLLDAGCVLERLVADGDFCPEGTLMAKRPLPVCIVPAGTNRLLRSTKLNISF